MNLNIEVDDKALRKAFAKAPSVVVGKIRTWINRTAAMTERAAKQEVPPRVDTGRMQSSIHIHSAGKMQAVVKPTAEYAYWVHEGRKPNRRMPPFQEGTDLNRWATKRGMNPFLVARSIGRKGTKGHPFMDKAYKNVKPRAESDARALLGDIVRAI